MQRKPKDDADLVPTLELAKALRESYDRIDHWAGEGLLIFQRRGRRRLFPLAVNVDRCRKIKALQDEGFSLPAIRKELDRTQ